MSNISERAMLIRNRISFWDARKYDRQVSNEIADQKGADHDAGRYNKQLFPRDAVRELQRIKTEAKDYHNRVTLAWEKNLRILPADLYMEYMNAMQEFRIKYEAAAADLERNYPQLMHDAKIRLNGLFDERDYPHQYDVSRRYKIETLVWPMPNSDDFRVSLSDAETRRIKKQMEEQLKEQLQESINDLWQRVYDIIERMRNAFADPDKRITEAMFRDLNEIVGLLPTLNVTGDPELDKLAKQLKGSLCKTSPDVVRNNPTVRKESAETADDILAAMAGYIGS